jgi:hypothetical protein
MLRFRASAAIAILLIFQASLFGPELIFASSRAHAQDKIIPQSEDPPGTDEEQTSSRRTQGRNPSTPGGG